MKWDMQELILTEKQKNDMKELEFKLLNEPDINVKIDLYRKYYVLILRQEKFYEYQLTIFKNMQYKEKHKQVELRHQKILMHMYTQIRKKLILVKDKDKIYQFLKETRYSKFYVTDYLYQYDLIHENILESMDTHNPIKRHSAKMMIVNNFKRYNNVLRAYARSNGFRTAKEKIYYDLDIDDNVISTLLNGNLVSSLYQRYKILLEKVLYSTASFEYTDVIYANAILLRSIEVSLFEKEYEDYIRCIFEMYGDEVSEIIDKAFKNKYIQYGMLEENSFCEYIPNLHAFVYLNTKEKSLETLMEFTHEMGHLVQRTIECKNNDILNQDVYSIATEVSSMLMQLSTWEFFFKKTNDEEIIVNVALKTAAMLFNNLVYLPQYLKFEISSLDLKKIDNKTVSNLQMQIIENFTTGEKILDKNARKYVEEDWVNIQDINTELSYTKYQFGTIVAINIIEKIKEDPGYINKYIEYLKRPNNINQVDAIKKYLEIDMRNPKTAEKAYNYAYELIDRILESDKWKKI